MERLAMRIWLIIALFSLHLSHVNGWDTDDLELFDLVEEVNKNFYELLGIEQSASSGEIRRAYRKLSLTLHPDKNKDEDAEVQFRQLVAVYEVLKDEEKRQKYNDVLVNGLPDWRQPVFYYRRVRKMGLLELGLLLLIIFTVGHFLVIWAAYFERRFEIEEVFRSRKKKQKKRKKQRQQQQQQQAEEDSEEELEEELETVHRPTLLDLLPIKLVCGTKNLIMSIPRWVQQAREEARMKKELLRLQEEERREMEEAEIRRVEELQELKKRRKLNRQKVELPQYCASTEGSPVVYADLELEKERCERERDEQENKRKRGVVKAGTPWSEEDHVLLAKAANKFPGGTTQRWEKVAEMVGRSVKEVTAMSKNIKIGTIKPVDPKGQGLTGSLEEAVNFKKGRPFDDLTMTQSSAWTANQTEADSAPGNPALRKRNRLINVSSNPEGSKNSDAESVVAPGSSASGPATTPAASATSNSTQPSKAPSLTVRPAGAASGASDTGDSQAVDDGQLWSQNQQKILEWALANYPKGTAERWEKIAEHIPGKTKEDCLVRFKHLAELVKKRKQQQQQQQQQ